jgi:hypothetical protein
MENLVEYILARKSKLEKICCSASLFTTNPTDQTRVRTPAAAVESQRLTA